MYCIVYMEVVITFIQDAYEYVHVPAIVSDADVQKEVEAGGLRALIRPSPDACPPAGSRRCAPVRCLFARCGLVPGGNTNIIQKRSLLALSLLS